MRKRLYILLVTRDGEGELRKIPIPLHYLYVFLAGALIGMLSITGIAGSYTRMLGKVATFNQLRTEKQALTTRYEALEREAQAGQRVERQTKDKGPGKRSAIGTRGGATLVGDFSLHQCQ